jgi:hypothetical protein
MNYRKKTRTNRFERDAERREAKARFLHGEGLYLYKNNTAGTLILPKPTSNGKTRVESGQEFEGDNYYMSLVQANSLRLVRELISPEQERQQKMLNEEKLILDQPPTVTNKGVVEHVAVDSQAEKQVENLQEGKPQENKNEVLLNDDPLDGVTILG